MGNVGATVDVPPPDGIRPRSDYRLGACPVLAFTRYSFASRLLCTNQSHRFIAPPPASAHTIGYHCTIITQYKIPFPTSRLYAIRHTILVITISCKGQVLSGPAQTRRARDTGPCPVPWSLLRHPTLPANP